MIASGSGFFHINAAHIQCVQSPFLLLHLFYSLYQFTLVTLCILAICGHAIIKMPVVLLILQVDGSQKQVTLMFNLAKRLCL